MSQLDTLKAELLTGHPDTGPYNVDNTIAASEINAVNRTLNRESMTASEVANAIEVSEFNTLSASDQARIWNVLHLGDINPFGVEATLFTGAFGGLSATITALKAARKTDVSRATELGLRRIGPGLVAEARRL